MKSSSKRTSVSSSRLKRLASGVLIAFLACVALLLLLDKVILPWYVQRGEVSVLPKVVGMNVDQAITVLDQAGYIPIKYETHYDEKFKDNTIIRQTPEGGDETKPGRKVYLIISGGKESVVMPELIGKNLRDARLLLVRANLDVGKTDMDFTDSIPAGVVFKQSPNAGMTVTTSQKIDLVVSQGPRAGRVEVPDLTGVNVNEALLRLGRVRLGLGTKDTTEKPGARPGTIFDQAPKPGELVTEGTQVDLFIVKSGQLPDDQQ